jgi:ATP-dependent protease ClpP protease subunit
MTQVQAAPQAQPAALPVFISFVAEINAQTVEALLSVVAQQVNRGIRDIHLLLSTPGGHIREGIAAYNILRGLPISLTTHNTGSVNSIGNVIYLAGETRLACPIANFMFHGAALNFSGQVRMERKDILEKSRNLDNDEGLIRDVVVERTSIDAEKANRLFLEAQFIRSNEACEQGIVHRIENVAVPPGSQVLQLVFQR